MDEYNLQGFDQFSGQGDLGYNQYGDVDPMTGMPMNYRGPKDNFIFQMNPDMLLSLGFTNDEIGILQECVNYFGNVTNQRLTNAPFFLNNQVLISRIMYAYQICMGKKIIELDEPLSLSKHFKKLMSISGKISDFTCLSVPHRDINIIPRVAVVAGLPKGSFYVLNSNNYDKMEATYPVEKIAKEWVTIHSTRRMAVRPEDRLNDSYSNREWGIPGILKVLDIGNFNENKPWVIQIHKSRCRLCNRFMIIISKKFNPETEEHHGGYVMVTAEGQLLYLYARTTDFDSYGNPKDKAMNPTKDRVVLDYGFYRNEIDYKLTSWMDTISQKWLITYSKKLPGATQFEEIPKYNGMTQIRATTSPEDTPDFDIDDVSGIDM
jgi:hypothetical protein